MSGNRKLWPTIGAAVLVVMAVLAGCERGNEHDRTGEGDGREAAPGGGDAATAVLSELGNPATDDIAYLTRLALMRGHLLVGMELFHTGALEAARRQLKYPGTVLYGGIETALVARGAPGFGRSLKRLAAVVDGDVTSTALEAAVRDVRAAIGKAEGAVAPEAGTRPETRPETRLRVAVHLTQAAATKYAAGVVDCAIVNGHDYQDALSFMQAAREIVASIDAAGDERLDGVLRQITEELTLVQAAWPEIVPPDHVEADASLLHDAVAHIEKAVSVLEQGVEPASAIIAPTD